MTQAVSKSDQAVFRLLSAAKKTPPDPGEAIEAEDYDWNVPSRFTPAQLDSLEALVADSCKSIAKELSAQLHEEALLLPLRPGQHYAGRLELTADGADSFLFALMHENGTQCGLVRIPARLAQSWVGKALGVSAGSENGDREFSTLESALLRDVVVPVANALAGEFRALGGGMIQCGQQVPAEHGLGEVKNDDEYCVLAFRVGEEKDNPAISFILSSDTLGQAIGGGNTLQAGDGSPGDSQEHMLACIGQASVTATVSLMTADLTLSDVLNIEVGDVLLAEASVDQPLELLVGGAVVLSGHPVSCDGQYALQITK
jgi:flagellar motor switch protein FliM